MSRDKAIRKIKHRDGSSNCHYCDRKLSDGEITIDHVISNSQLRKLRSDGIDLVLGWKNYVISCVECNQAKGDRSYVEFCALSGITPKYDKDLIFDLRQLTRKVV